MGVEYTDFTSLSSRGQIRVDAEYDHLQPLGAPGKWRSIDFGSYLGNPMGRIGVRATSAEGPKMSFGVTNGTYTGGSILEAMTINTLANVGIGTTNPVARLDVNGGIRVGTTNDCAVGGTHDGTIRYNGLNLQFCKGGVLQDVGTGSG